MPVAVKMEVEDSVCDSAKLISSPGRYSEGAISTHCSSSSPPVSLQQYHQQLQAQQNKFVKSQSDSCSFSSTLRNLEENLRLREENIRLREKGVVEGVSGSGNSSSLVSLGNSFASSIAEGDSLGSLGGPGSVFQSSRGPQKPLTGDEVQCTMCGRILCNKYVLKVHMRDVHAPRSMHQCPLCGRCYSTINSLRVHISTIHK